jgi:O-antigen/teichoic acid export membrane protein
MTSQHIAAVLVGPGFREGVAALIPIMCVTALIHGVRNHFVDHTFHLSGRSAMMLWTYGPAAIANVAINLVTVPAYGMFGAAWTGLGCQTAALLLSWLVGRRVFPLWLPLWQVARIAIAVLAMAAAIASFQFPLTWLGLLGEVSLGAVVYAVACIALDVGGTRSLVRARLTAAVGR